MKMRSGVIRSEFSLCAALFLFLSPMTLWAQTAVTVTTNAGDESVGSLGWAVTTLNAAGAGSITLAVSNPITLTQALSSLTQNVTFMGAANNVIGQNDSQSQFLFQQGFNQQGNLYFQNNGALGAGLDVAVTASSWNIGSLVVTDLNAANAATISTTNGTNVTGAAGGNASVTVGDWTTGLSTYLFAGAGGSVTDTNGSGDAGGAGGSASVTANSMTLPGTGYFYLNGGVGGSVTDLGTGANTGGAGGSASAAFGSVSISGFGNLGVNGGAGGAGVTGGAGGTATLTAASVSLSQNFDVFAGQGGNGVSAGGAGGGGYASFGSYMGDTGSNFQLTGGNGGNAASGTGGNGGSVLVAGGTATIVGVSPNAPFFEAVGGNGGTGLSGGNGGGAGISLTSLVIGPSATFKVSGGNGSGGFSGAAPGNGGQGGGTSFSLGTFSIGVSTTLNISSGNGGSGGGANAGGTGGAGGAGGNLAVTFGALNLGTGSILNLTGGTGGSGGNVVSGGIGGAGGAGGGVSLSIGAVTMASGNSLNIDGGSRGLGGTAATNGPGGALGQASASIGDLEGAGTVAMNGNALLQVAQGNFSGSLSGSETLQKTGATTLTLSGSNYYSGGTSIVGGVLKVDTGGVPGTGGIEVGLGTLDYIHSSVAVNSVTVANGGTIQFQDSSSAGLATVILQSGGLGLFTASATGGIAGFTDLAGATLDIGGSTSGGVTIGSLAGAGGVSLGANTLGIGTNGASTTFSGTLSGTGSLALVGGGLTLSGTNTYSGGTNLEVGTLAAASTQALGTGSVTVNGGTLAMAGSGPLTLSIGGSLGGNYFQSSSGTLQLTVAGAGAALSDALAVTGISFLNGTLALLPGSGLTAPTRGSSVTVLTASSISGIFQQVDESFGGIRLLPLYLSNAVELESIIPSFQAVGTTPNQKAIGADLDTVALKPQMNALMASIGILSNADMQAAYGQLTLEDFTALYQAGFEGALARTALVDQRLSQLMDEVDNTAWLPGFSSTGTPWFAANLSASKEAAMAPKKADPWGGFVSGDGGFFNVSGDSNASGYKVTTYGLSGAGADYRLSREMVAGLIVGYGHTDVTMGTGGSLTADGGQLGLYGLFYSEGFYTSALVEGGINSYGSQRQGYGGIAKGSTQGSQYDGALELGYQFKQAQVKIGPMASLQYSYVGMNGFTEQGSQAPLTVPTQSQDSLLSRLGVRANSHWSMGSDASLNPSIQLAWEHEYNYQGGTYQAGFGTGDGFTVAGPQIGQDGFLAGAGVEITWAKSLTLSLNYQGEFGRTNLNSNQVGGSVRFGF